jgi:hypothetical protein
MRRIPRSGTRTLKRCGCGREYTRAEWNELRLAGEQVDDVERGELRDCLCGSTIAVGRLRVRVAYNVEAIEGGWLLYRKAGSGEEIAFGIGAPTGGMATVFPTKRAAESMIPPQRRADRAAATRLDVEIIEVGPANDTEAR